MAPNSQSTDPLLAAALRGELDQTQARQPTRRGSEAVTLMLMVPGQTHRRAGCVHYAAERTPSEAEVECSRLLDLAAIHRDCCPHCKKDVEPVVPDAMPGATLGHSVVSLTSLFHYGLGFTIAQVIDILSHHLQTKITPGGLVDAWQRLGTVLADWYEQIAEQAQWQRENDTPIYKDADTLRIAKRLRKNSQSNRSEQGAATQAVLMNVYRTLRLRGLDPTKTITAALRIYLQTGKLPPLPEKTSASG
ncbi:MAG: hypothetical protein AABZ47_17940 [Planctomycetota bacterium]